MAKLLKKNTDAQKRRIFLVEDHPVFRDGLSKLLNAEADLMVCGEAGDAKQALKAILKLKPDLAVLEGHIYVSEEVFSGEAARRAGKKKPGALDLLTDSELEVLELLGDGKSTSEISQQLGLTDPEVNTHGMSIRRKLKLESHNALVRYAVTWIAENSK